MMRQVESRWSDVYNHQLQIGNHPLMELTIWLTRPVNGIFAASVALSSS